MSDSIVQDLKIEKVEVIPLSVPLEKTFKGSHYFMTHRCTIITRIYTRGGIIGECYNGDEFETQDDIVKIIEEEMVPALIGESCASPERCWQLTRPSTFNILRDRKLAFGAQACLDSAVWDAFGKAVEQPLYRLWGGYTDTLRIIAIAGYYEEGKGLDDYAHEMRELIEMGFGGCKFKVGGRDPEEDAERVRTACKVVDKDFWFCVDANQGWSLRQAIDFARLVEDLPLRWFEEPCHWDDDRRLMADVRRITGIQVTAGQGEISASGCRDLMIEGAIDYCNFDASWSGGPTEWRRVAAMASAFSVKMAHHEEPQVAAHLLASIPHGSVLETFHPVRDPLFYGLVANRSPFRNGFYKVPEGPGFGLELDAEYIKKYRVD